MGTQKGLGGENHEEYVAEIIGRAPDLVFTQL